MRLVTLGIVPALLVTACGGGTVTATRSSTPGSTAAPAASLRTPVIVGEATVEHAIEAGQQTVLLFMATGCSSCAAQASALVAGAAGRHVQLVGVDVSPADDQGTLREFLVGAGLGALPITWTIDTDQSLDQRYQVQSLDETVGLAGGTVRFHNPASVDAARLHQQIGGLA